MPLDQDIWHYVKLRDLKAERKFAYEASVADLNTGMANLEDTIMANLNDHGVESVRTVTGTASKSVSTSATIVDWDVFLQFVRENDRWDMLVQRCSTVAVEQYRAANDNLPPGVNWVSAPQTSALSPALKFDMLGPSKFRWTNKHAKHKNQLGQPRRRNQCPGG